MRLFLCREFKAEENAGKAGIVRMLKKGDHHRGHREHGGERGLVLKGFSVAQSEHSVDRGPNALQMQCQLFAGWGLRNFAGLPSIQS
jgi:hypothetical protein